MVLERQVLERFVSMELIDQLISKIQAAPDGKVIFRAKRWETVDIEETLFALADAEYTIGVVGSECIFIKKGQ